MNNYDTKLYAYPFITWEQYRKLVESDNRLKATSPEKWKMLNDDAEQRLRKGCDVCGFRGMDRPKEAKIRGIENEHNKRRRI